MKLSKSDAIERSERIWGRNRVKAVNKHQMPTEYYYEVELWRPNLTDATQYQFHSLDQYGRAVCHAACGQLERRLFGGKE